MKRISSVITSVLSYVVIIAYICMLAIPLIITRGGGVDTGNLVAILSGYFIFGIILCIVLSHYVNVEISLESYDVVVKTSILNRRKILKKKDVLQIKALNLLFISPTYYIKYLKNNRKTGYYLFTKDLNADIEKYLNPYR